MSSAGGCHPGHRRGQVGALGAGPGRGGFLWWGWVALAVMLLAGPALAAPPPVGSEQWEILHPHRAWVEGVAGPQGVCCSLADGRAVEARRQGDRWQVLFPPERGFPTGWQDVPEAAVLVGENPVGMPVAWWHGGAVRCFVPGSGT